MIEVTDERDAVNILIIAVQHQLYTGKIQYSMYFFFNQHTFHIYKGSEYPCPDFGHRSFQTVGK